MIKVPKPAKGDKGTPAAKVSKEDSESEDPDTEANPNSVAGLDPSTETAIEIRPDSVLAKPLSSTPQQNTPSPEHIRAADATEAQVLQIAAATSKINVSNGAATHLRPPRTLETTLFDRLERLYGAGIKRVLQVQYRYVRSNKPSLLELFS